MAESGPNQPAEESGPTEPAEESETTEPAEESGPTREELKLALKAFNKRLRLTRLDDESKLGHGAMTAGGKSGVVAITPPHQFPREMWEELVKKGKLKYVGHGLYEPVDG